MNRHLTTSSSSPAPDEPAASSEGERLQNVLSHRGVASRRHADPETSYTAKLFANGPDSILKKIGEESAELIMAAKDGKRLNIVWESTDLIYHIMVLLAFYGMGIEDVSQEMRRREGISGIDEKKSRTAK